MNSMDNELDKIKKKLHKEFDDLLDVDPDSDLPVTEKKVKDKKIRML